MDGVTAMIGEFVDSIAALETAIGKTPPPMHLKVIDHLDSGALAWIANSPLMFICAGSDRAIAVTMAGGQGGFAGGDADMLRVPMDAVDDPNVLRPGLGFGALLLLPGIGETLRVNGQIVAVEAGIVQVRVQECYGHCAKALIRSDFWSAAAAPDFASDANTFVAAARFMALATIDAEGRADLSPKGDPAGNMTRMDGETLWFAERPGNRRADSLRNLLVQPRLAALLLVPGTTSVVRIGGVARISRDERIREQFSVREKMPTLATGVERPEITIYQSLALARADLWPVTAPVEDIDSAGIFLAHIKLNRSLVAKVASALLSLPGMDGLMRKGLEKDYKSNLY